MAAPNKPTALTGTRGDQQVALGWTAPAAGDAPTSYEVQVDGFTVTVSPTGDITSGTARAIDFGAIPGTPFEQVEVGSGTVYKVTRAMAILDIDIALTLGASTRCRMRRSTTLPTESTINSAGTQVFDINSSAGNFTRSQSLTNLAANEYVWFYTSTTVTITARSVTVDGGNAWITGITGTSHTVTGLTNGQIYRFRVRAKNSDGVSSPTPNVEAKPATFPDAPTSLIGRRTAYGVVDLGFTTPASDGGEPITRYEYNRDDTGWEDGHSPRSPVQVTALSDDWIYSFKVRAVNAVGPGPESNLTTVKMGFKLDYYCKMELSNGTYYFSTTGMVFDQFFCEPRLTNISRPTRRINIVPGRFSLNGVTFGFSNADNFFGKLRAEAAWRNRPIELWVGDLRKNEPFTLFYSGKITYWNASDPTCRIESLPSISTELRQTIDSPIVNTDTFSDTPVGGLQSGEEIVPIMLGDLSTQEVDDIGGFIPAWAINTGQGGTWKYVACWGKARIDEVWNYNTKRQTNSYTITEETYGGKLYTILNFTSNPINLQRTDRTAIRWVGAGLSDTGGALTNPVAQTRVLLDRLGYDTTDPSFAIAEARFAQRPIHGGVLVTFPTTLEVILWRIASSYNLDFSTSSTGRISVATYQGVPNSPEVKAEIDLFGNRPGVWPSGPSGLGIQSPRQFASRIRYNYRFSGLRGQPTLTGEFTDPVQEARLGEDIDFGFDLPFIKDSESATRIIRDKAFMLAEERQIVTLSTDPEASMVVNPGDLIRVSHFVGVGVNGRYERALFRVLDVILTIQDNTDFCAIRAVDVEPGTFQITRRWEQFYQGMLPGQWLINDPQGVGVEPMKFLPKEVVIL